MNNAKFPAKLIEIESFRDDRGHLFEQFIIVEAETGEQFWIQDLLLYCDNEMKGKIIEIDFSVSQSFSGDNLVKQDNKEKKIVVKKMYSGNKYSLDYPTFYGEIVGRMDDPSELIVDVGSGTISVSINKKEVDNFLIGDYIKIRSSLVQF
ncbi:hypothetical protein HNP86_001339 [Methanococcus maripaludis]|uniref:Uncharacterized protein n=1 Tax=Methanococcus maripaludis TaxID=39152 RepID=A0A7J9NU56_METMI|nr:hypothetical protein [Methanococcus maripaludis]MBA2851208.1 hypothetical protein [Methanococcus maripaludis]